MQTANQMLSIQFTLLTRGANEANPPVMSDDAICPCKNYAIEFCVYFYILLQARSGLQNGPDETSFGVTHHIR